jgi:transposase
MTTSENKIYIGIDVSKAVLDIFISANSSYYQYENSSSGIKKLMTKLKKIF